MVSLVRPECLKWTYWDIEIWWPTCWNYVLSQLWPIVCLPCLSYRRGQSPQDQIVVTPSLSTIGMETRQLTEENADFASRGRYHHSSFITSSENMGHSPHKWLCPDLRSSDQRQLESYLRFYWSPVMICCLYGSISECEPSSLYIFNSSPHVNWSDCKIIFFIRVTSIITQNTVTPLVNCWGG